MAKGANIWTFVVILLLAYAMVPSVNTFVNNLVGIGNFSSSKDTAKESSENLVKCSDDNLSQSQFFMSIALLLVATIAAAFIGYKYHQKHAKVKKDGRPTKGINKD